MALPSRDVIEDLDDLIKEITKFKEDDENFVTCEQYCLSHLVHHSYPSVNKTDVQKTVDDYVSRFYMHGYFKVADALKSQTDSFLSNEELFKKNPEFDIQWSLLSLLNGLSTNLTSVSKVPDLLPIDIEEEINKEDVNWAEILKNDLPNNNFDNFYETDVDDSSWLEDSENEIKNDLQEEEKDEKFKVIIMDEKTSESDFASRQEAINQVLKYREEKISIEKDKKKFGDFNRIYETFVNSQGLHSTSQMISMYEVIEKILFQFQSGDDIFKRRGITTPALTCLTNQSLDSYLSQYEPYFEIMRIFKEFMSDVANSRFQKSNNSPIPNVMKAYNSALSKALESFDEKIMELDSNKDSSTLLSLQLEIRPYFSDLASLYNVHREITKNWLNDENWVSAVKIISILYNAMMDTTNNRMSRVYLNMFLHCFQVYLDIIDTWIACVKLTDPHGEFVITSSESKENACCEYSVRPYRDVLLQLKIPKMEILDFISDKMIHVGLSLEVLSRLERYDTQETILSYKPKESLYKLLQKDIQNDIRRLTCTATKPNTNKEKSIFTIKNNGIGNEKDDGGGDHEGLLGKNENPPKINGFFDKAFQDVFSLNLKFQEKSKQEYVSVDFFCNCCSDQQSSDFLPLRKIVKQHVKSLLNDRVLNACTLVKNIILDDFNLKKHVALLRSVMFFNDAYLILPFTFLFFNQPSTWQNSYLLTLHLKECVETAYKDLASRLTVVVAEDSSDVNNVLEAIDSISIRYEVEWPLNLIINEKNMERYNEIFRLILKLKWAHSMLCNLRFQKYDKEAPAILKTTYHRLQLLRIWCLSALNRVITYYMAHVSTRFSEELDSCQHLKDIINAHENFIRKIHSRCLLTVTEMEGRDLIFHALIPLCKDIRESWQRGVVVAESKLTLMENIFGGCHQQLSVLMTSLEKD